MQGMLDYLLTPKNPKALIERFKDYATDTFGGGLVSIILYGSAASGEYKKGISDLNFAIVLKQIDFDILKLFAYRMAKLGLGGNLIKAPFILTDKELNDFSTNFPIEFLSIYNNHKCIYGKDLFEKLKINKEALKRELLQELRSKLIRFRQLYTEAKRAKRLRSFLVSSVSAFSQITKALLYLKGVAVPKSKEERLKKLEELGIDVSPLRLAYYMKYKGANPIQDKVDDALLKMPKMIEGFINSL